MYDFEQELNSVYFDFACDFFDDDSCDKYMLEKYNVINERPFFSIIMATYNDDRLINSAINSLLKQCFRDWELVIVDNSDTNDNMWRLLTKISLIDSRIKIIRSEKNVGWPKAASICMKHIKGKYTTFLAADDCLNDGALEHLYNEIVSKEYPDILWVGHGCVEYSQNKVKLLGGSQPQKNDWFETERSSAIVDIMKGIYYNSFFHYMKVDFLREENIDFFEPYHSDCAGMTRAMTRAKKMSSTNEIVYFLTMNTSQTKGRYTWDSFDFVFANQWRSIKEIFVRENFSDKESIQYVAKRIINNLFSQVDNLCVGLCRDIYQCPMIVDDEAIFKQLEDILCNKDINEMIRVTDIEGFVMLVKSFGNIPVSQYENGNWVLDFARLNKCLEEGDITEQIIILIRLLSNEKNVNFIGMPYFLFLLKNVNEEVIVRNMNEIKQIINGYKEVVDNIQFLG